MKDRIEMTDMEYIIAFLIAVFLMIVLAKPIIKFIKWELRSLGKK